MESITTVIVAIVVSASIPSAVFGMYIRRLEKKIDRQSQYESSLLHAVRSGNSLSHETARHAIRKGCANGFLTKSLEHSEHATSALDEIVRQRAVHD